MSMAHRYDKVLKNFFKKAMLSIESNANKFLNRIL